MSERHGLVGKLTDLLKGKLTDLVGALAPEPDAIPIPVRDDPRRGR
ncbi:MAG: hypothetical protein AAF919_06495 [Pseudomonadota bacterium]